MIKILFAIEFLVMAFIFVTPEDTKGTETIVQSAENTEKGE